MTDFVFPLVDMQKTGENIKRLREQAGISVKEMQQLFSMENPQAIYKWQQGKNLPSVDHLLALSRLLKVPIDQLLVESRPEASMTLYQSEHCGHRGAHSFFTPFTVRLFGQHIW